METDRLELLRSELRARERVTRLLGLDIERPIRSVADGYPENAITLVGKATERVLKDLWRRVGTPGDPSTRALSDLIKGVKDHVEDSGVLDALGDIQRLRNRSTHDGYDVTAEDAYLVLRRFTTVLEWIESGGAGNLHGEFELVDAVAERLRFVSGLQTTLGYSLSKRFDLSPTSVYVLFERVEGLRAEYVEILFGSDAEELVSVLQATGGELIRTSYPMMTRFVLVDRHDQGVDGLPMDSMLLTYQEYLDTIVDSRSLVERANERLATIAMGAVEEPVRLAGDALELDAVNVTFEVRRIPDVERAVGDVCQRRGANLLLIGPAGCGKTHLLARLAAQPVEDGRYRFLLDLADRRPDEPIEELVTRQLGRTFSVAPRHVWPVFAYLIRSGRCVCLVDAIDEAAPGGAIDDIAELFGHLSVLLSASSTTVLSCRQSFLLDTPYVRQLLDQPSLTSDRLASRLVSAGVDPLSLPHFSVLRIGEGGGDESSSPLRLTLRRAGSPGATLFEAASARIRQACHEASIEWERLVAAIGPRCVVGSPAFSILELVAAVGLDVFEGPPSPASWRLPSLMVGVDDDHLRFRHQVLREALAAAFLISLEGPRPELHGAPVTDQTRAFVTEASNSPHPGRACAPGNYLVGPPGGMWIHVLEKPFELADSPVSVGEYRSFLESVELGGVDLHPANPDPTSVLPLYGRLRRSGYYDDRSSRHPAICVSWWGAWAYARWSGFRLPSSIEWEIAARGRDGRLFPWGDAAVIERVNCADHWAGHLLPTWTEWKQAHDRGELREGYPTPPDQFSENISPFGCLAMAGNVWEWTATVVPGGTRAVIAGGSYDNPIRAVRCSSRGAYRLGGRSNAVGFRVMEPLT